MNPFTPKPYGTTPQPRRRLNVNWPVVRRELAGGTALLGYAGIALASLWAIAVVSALTAVAGLALAAFLGLVFVRVAHAQAPRRALTLSLAAATLIASVTALAAITAFSFAPVAIPAWIVSALYGATMLAGAWKQLRRLERIAAVLVALVFVAVATSLVVVPGSGEEAAAERPGFEVTVTARDMHGTAVADALANCSLFDFWNMGRQAGFTFDAKITDTDGKAGPWTFAFDHPFKAVLCSATAHPKNDPGPLSEDAPGAEPASPESASDKSKISTRAIYFPLPGGTYSITLGVDPPFDPNAP